MGKNNGKCVGQQDGIQSVVVKQVQIGQKSPFLQKFSYLDKKFRVENCLEDKNNKIIEETY